MRGRETVKIAMQNQIMTRETSEKKTANLVAIGLMRCFCTTWWSTDNSQSRYMAWPDGATPSHIKNNNNKIEASYRMKFQCFFLRRQDASLPHQTLNPNPCHFEYTNYAKQRFVWKSGCVWPMIGKNQQLQMTRLSLRNNWLKFIKNAGKPPI